MSESKVLPALTAEEWKRELDFKASDPDGWTMYETLGGSYERHGVAALLLYGQPFGFTREDVLFLRQCARDEVNGINGPEPNQFACDRANSIADRIEALLPPLEASA